MPTQPSKYKLCCRPETCLLCGKHILMCDGGTVSRDHLDVLKESQWEIHRPRFLSIFSCHRRKWRIKVSPNFLGYHLAISEGKHLNWKLKVNPSCQFRYAFSSEYDLTGIGPVTRLVSQPCLLQLQETKTPHEFLDERRYHSMMIQYSQLSIQEIAG
ncbi:hypothetical protein N7527_006288 [Penicillium freii]|nr:hypothetical protein N7527_006288 [Penicillium freii]